MRRQDENDPWPEGLEAVPQGVWLIAPHGDADEGLRPVPSGQPFWESPYIWMRDAAGQLLTQAVAGEPVFVFARIRNRGTLTSFPTRISFAFIDAALGIPPSAPKVFGEVRTNVPPNLLGPGVVDVACPVPWVPGAYSTHACLLVMSDGELWDRPTVPWNPQLDRHVAQRNVTITAASPGQTLALPLLATPFMEGAATLAFAAQAAWVQAREPAQALRYVPEGREPRGTQVEPGVLKEALRWERIDVVDRLEEGTVRFPEMEGGEAPGYVTVGERFESRPLEVWRVDAGFTVPAPPDDSPFLLLRIAQTEDGLITGGYTVLLQVRE